MRRDPQSKLAGHWRRKGLLETDLEHELLLLDPATQEMYSLNTTGRLVWKHLVDDGLDGVAARMVEAFGITPEQARADALDLVQDLVSAGLLEPVEPADPRA